MRKPRAFQLGEAGQANTYHVVTRVAGGELVFDDAMKETFRIILLKQLKFSGLRALAWCFMGNHLHLLLEVPDRERALRDWTEEQFVGRLKLLKSELSTRMQLADLAMFRENGHAEGVAEIVGRVRARLFDLSMFMKELKQKLTLAFNTRHGRRGTLWEGRFKSVLLEGGEAVRMVAAYIDLNPVRAGIVSDPAGYRWCSYAAAVAGSKAARQGLAWALTGKEDSQWRKVSGEYRMLLFGSGQEKPGGETVDGREPRKGGFTQAEIEEVWKARGKLPLAMALRCRVRYFTDGVVLGSQGFVDGFFEKRKAYFGSRRKNGGRRMRDAEWGDVRVLRDLKEDVVRPSSA